MELCILDIYYEIAMRLSVCNSQYHLISLRQQLLHRRQRAVFVHKLFDKIYRSVTLSSSLLTQNFNENFIFFAKCHCLSLFTQQ